jgi:hypothetical protein
VLVGKRARSGAVEPLGTSHVNGIGSIVMNIELTKGLLLPDVVVHDACSPGVSAVIFQVVGYCWV